MKKAPPPLTMKERVLVNEILEGGQHQVAALKAGFSPTVAKKQVARVLRRAPVQAYMQKRIQDMEEKLEVTYDWKISVLREIADKGEKDADRIHAIAELNRMQGDLAAEKRININIGVEKELEAVKQIFNSLLEANRKPY